MRVLLVAATMAIVACSSQPPPLPLPPAERGSLQAASPPDDIADRPFSIPLPPSDAEQILMATGVFDMADPGFRPGRQVQAFNVLLEQPDAHDRFRRLASNGQAAGRLYALCALLLLARPEGIVYAHSLSLRPGDVTVRQGDNWFVTPTVRAIVLVFANEVPARLVERRDESYAYFGGPD